MAQFDSSRISFGKKFIYASICSRAKGLTVIVNMNPDGRCNFACPYCNVDRRKLAHDLLIDTDTVSTELKEVIDVLQSESIFSPPFLNKLPPPLRRIRHIALSGDGEPTLCERFSEIVDAVLHVRALYKSFFPIVLFTNGTGLTLPDVQLGLSRFQHADQIWMKLDGGSQDYLEKVNLPDIDLEEITKNILSIAQKRTVVIQSLFPSINGRPPESIEIAAYLERLKQLIAKGAKIGRIQIYSATKPYKHSIFGHLSLAFLSDIADLVRKETGLLVETF